MSEIVCRQSKKELWIWRIIFLITIAIFFMKKDPNKNPEIKQDSIVRSELYTELFYDENLINNIYELAENDKVKAVLLKINCPGGEITASEAVYKALSAIRSKKPLVISVGSSAASGGYLVSLAANKIYAYDTSIVGSIGVMNAGFFDASGLEEKLGIKFFNYKSSSLKALPDGYNILGMRLSKKPDEEGEKHLQQTINEFQLIFKDIVQHNRPQIKDIEYVTNGMEFTGRRGLELGLVDAIGTDRDAMNDLQTNFNLKSALPVVDYNIVPVYPEKEGGLFVRLLGLFVK